MKTVCVILFLFLILCLSPAWSQTAKNIAYLKGTYYSLDMYNGNMKDGAPMPMGDGLLSKCGWTFIDDSRSYLFDHSEWPWLKERDANIVLTDDLANMESVGRAITYAPSSFTQKMEFFHDRYARLDEVLKAQKLNDADYKFFVDYTY